MYKAYKISKVRLVFNKFKKTAKNVSIVYRSGIRNWVSDDSFNYSIVIYTFRIIFSVDRPQLDQVC